MKRRAGLLRLYPGEWRQRYGDEFAALLEDVPAGWTAYFDLLRGALLMRFSTSGFSTLAAMLSIVGLVAGLGASYVVKPVWESTVMLRFTSDGSGADRIASLQSEVLSRGSLSRLSQEPRLKLYESDRAHMPPEDVIDNMRRDIRIQSLSGGNKPVFAVSFRYYDRLKTQLTVQYLALRFSDENRRQLVLSQTTGSQPRMPQEQLIGELQMRIGALERRLGVPPPEVKAADARGFMNDLEVLDAPSMPFHTLYPNRGSFMTTGFAVGFFLAVLIAGFRRRPMPVSPLAV